MDTKIPYDQYDIIMQQKISLKKRREVVKSLWQNGTRNVNELHKITKFPLRTLFRWTSQLKKTKDLKQGYRPGRPKILSPKKRRHLGQLARSRAGATSFEITNTLNNIYPELNIATRTVRENLWKLGYRVCIPKKTPFLTPIAKERRVAWANVHKRKKWGNVIFSDETTIQMFRNTTLVRYKEGEEKPTRGIVKHPFKIHIWGAFCAQGIVGFHMFTENMNGELYREILTNNLFNQASQLLGESWTFQQDNDPKHKARLTVSLLENQCPAILDWPSYSPDLNPIENLWSILKKRVEQKVNKRISKKKPVTQVIFMDIIKEEWGNIDQNLCLNLANSMKKRIELVIKRNGSIIQY